MGDNMLFGTLDWFLTGMQSLIVLFCVLLIEAPVFSGHNFLLFLIGAFSFYLYILTLSNLKY